MSKSEPQAKAKSKHVTKDKLLARGRPDPRWPPMSHIEPNGYTFDQRCPIVPLAVAIKGVNNVNLENNS